MSTRTLGMLAIFAASSLFIPPILTGGNREPVWAWWIPIGSIFAFTAAALGLALQFQDRIGRLGAVGAILVALGSAMIFASAMIVGASAVGLAVIPVGSAMLTWDLARIAVLSRRASIAHLAAVASFLPGLAMALPSGGQTNFELAVVGAVCYLLSWIAIGVSLNRGVPQPQATSA